MTEADCISARGKEVNTNTSGQQAEEAHTHKQISLHWMVGDECGLILWLECPRWEGSDLLLRAISYRPEVQPDGIPRHNERIYSYSGNRINPESIHINNISSEYI